MTSIISNDDVKYTTFCELWSPLISRMRVNFCCAFDGGMVRISRTAKQEYGLSGVLSNSLPVEVAVCLIRDGLIFPADQKTHPRYCKIKMVLDDVSHDSWETLPGAAWAGGAIPTLKLVWIRSETFTRTYSDMKLFYNNFLDADGYDRVYRYHTTYDGVYSCHATYYVKRTPKLVPHDPDASDVALVPILASSHTDQV